MNDLKWYEKPMRIGAIQWTQGENTFQVPEILHEGAFNTEQLLHIMASDENISAVFDKERDQDRLKEYIAKSKALGTRIILYFNAHIIDRTDTGKHPDWVQRHMDGEVIRAYDTYVLTCVNSSWRDEFMKRIGDGLELGLDGIFLDGPIFFNTGCYCKSCRERFTSLYGHSLEDASQKEMRDFKTEGIARFVKDVKEVILKKGTDTILYANSHGLSPNVTGCDIDGIFPHVDFLGTEAGFIFYTDPNKVSIWKGSQNAKYLEAKAKGKPVVIFTAGNHCPWARYMHTPEESRLLFASAVANGANVWYGIHGQLDTLSTPGGRAAYEFNRFLARNEEYYSGTERYADAAIVWSKNTIHTFFEDVEKTDFTEEEIRDAEYEQGSFMNEFKGMYDILIRNHTQFAVIDEKNLAEDDMGKFKAIVLPNTSALSPEACRRIEEYVRKGGTIISTMAVSMYNGAGERLRKPILSDVLGIDEVEEILTYKRGCSYLRLEGADKPAEGLPAGLSTGLSEGLSADLTAGFTKTLKCRFNGSARIIASMYMPMEGVYAAFPEEKYPALAVNSYGEGHSIFIAGGLGETWSKLGITDLKKLMQNIINSAVKSDISLENAFETVETELRLQPKKSRLLLHLVNFTGQMQRPLDRIIECGSIKVALKPGRKVTRVHTLYNSAELEFRTEGDRIEFSLPPVKEYELVAVETE